MTTSQPARGLAGLEDAGVQRILGRSAVYELLALGITYPTEASVQRLVDLAEDLEGHDILKAYGLAPRLAAIRETVEAVEVPELQLEHNRLFLGQVLCSPHETEYERDTFSKAAQLADIAGFYNAWGLQTSESRRTMPDFVGTELEFLAMVTRREAYAALRGWANRRKVARESADAFMQTHLGRWVNAFAADLRGVVADDAAGRFYAALARAIEQFVVMDVAVAGVTPAMLTLRIPRPEDDEPMVCMDDPNPMLDDDTFGVMDEAEPDSEVDLPAFPSFE
ncbi:MAG: molecular chaperone TorD family protein [Dehalococcoidia bacterium]|nr:molecular chaperone TorD family protein [Dehalococcoidia bacterium]